jgi:hypothetical protein
MTHIRKSCGNCRYHDEPFHHPVCTRCFSQIGYKGTWEPIQSSPTPAASETLDEALGDLREAFQRIHDRLDRIEALIPPRSDVDERMR